MKAINPFLAERWPASGLTLALLTLVLSSGVQAFSAPAADNDLWGHLYFGREILRSGLVATNLYSYTAPTHPWINHEILAECAFAWTYDRWGSPGLLGLKLGIGLWTLGIMMATARNRAREPAAWAAALVAACFLMSWGYLIRPQIFTFLALALLWHLLQRHARGARAGLWMLPLLFAVWVNAHGGVLAGIAVLGLFALLYPRGPNATADRKRLGIVFVTSCVALLANPYGIDLVIFLFRDVLRDRAITEWLPIALFDASSPGVKLAALVFVLAAASRSFQPLWEVAIIALAMVATFRHGRHLPLFAILLAPFLAESLSLLIERFRSRGLIRPVSRRATSVAAAAAILVAGIQIATTLQVQRSLGFGIFVPPDLFPVQAVRFIAENRLRGNLAVPFDWGEYAIWHLYPAFRVSVDGRYTTAYPDEVIEACGKYLQGSEGWDRILAGADFALADRRHPTTRRLVADGRWREIYGDATAVLFARADVRLPEPLAPPSPIQVREAILFP